jgi:8-oxo-dGTP diphosphatase
MKEAVGVAGIIPRGDTVLVLRRSPGDHFLPGAYDLPGGGLKPGEHPESGIIREVLEETGLHAEVVRSLGSRSYLQNPSSGKRDKTMFVYLLKVSGEPDVRLSEEHDEHRWILDSDLGEIFASDDLMRSVIHQYFRSEHGSRGPR